MTHPVSNVSEPAFPIAGMSPILRKLPEGSGALPATLPLAGSAGSGRAYYRVPGGGLVLLVSPPGDPDFGRFLRITGFYRALRFPVPRIHGIDEAAGQALLEDLGDRRLYDLLRADRKAGLEAYRKVLAVLADLQTRCHSFHADCPDIQSRIFDRGQLLWETSYYREHYLEGYRGLVPDPGLQTVFEALADRVDSHPRTIMHRDFQSQNLMVKPDGSVHVIDYQGSRLGSVYYDLASLLLDPYVLLDDGEIEELLNRFHGNMEDAPAFARFRGAFLEAGLQRVMQALGAYCFLSRVKGMVEFATHIPAGEIRLRWLIRETGREWRGVLPD